MSFDAAVISSFTQQFPLSLQIYKYNGGGWESLPMGPISDGKYTDLSTWYDFWRYGDILTPPTDDKFRPTWATASSNSVQTVSFGDVFPNTIQSGEIEFDTAITKG